MNRHIYFCSEKFFKQFNLGPTHSNLYNHVVVKKDKFSYIYPKDKFSKTINPKSFYNIKTELGFTQIVIVDKIYSTSNIVNVSDHINRTGVSYLRGKTPFKNCPTFPDISNIYSKRNGKVLMSIGDKNSLNINTKENVILSSWIAAISPVWHYVGTQVIGLGINKNLSSINEIIEYIK